MVILQALFLFCLFPSTYYSWVYFKQLVNSGFTDFSVVKNLLFSLFVLLFCLAFTGLIPIFTTGIF